jgi:uncharacterized SAM-binding protein YcdF (DUF218 family)
MFALLTQIILWSLIFGILWYVFVQFIPRLYLTWLGGLLVAVFIILAFFDPTDRTVSAVWSLLSLPLRPLGLTLLLLLVALREGVKKAAGNLVLAALLVLLLSSTPIVSYWLTTQTEQTVVESIAAQGDRAPDPARVRAIVVLGDAEDPAYSVRTQVSGAQSSFGTPLTSRLLYVTDLYRTQSDQGNNPLVIVSTGQQNSQNVAANQSITEFLTSRGVSTDRILIEANGTSVRSSAFEVNQLLRDRGFQQGDSILLVSSALNIRRASSTFAQLGLDPIARPTDLYGFQFQVPDDRLLLISDLVPNVNALVLTTRVVDEYLASIYYFLRGWLVNPTNF